MFHLRANTPARHPAPAIVLDKPRFAHGESAQTITIRVEAP